MARLTGLLSKSDLAQLRLTYEDLAYVYFIGGKANGQGTSLWQKVGQLLDRDQSKYNKYVYDKDTETINNYNKWQYEWERVLLGEVNPDQHMIDELNQVVIKAQEQIEILTQQGEK